MTENISSYSRYKPIISAHSYYKESQQIKEQQESESRIDQIEKDFKLQQGAVLGDRVRVRKNQFAEAFHGKGREENVQSLLQSVVFEMFLDALAIDDNAKKENTNMLRKIFDDHYESVGAKDVFSGIKILGPLAAQKYSENPLQFKIKSICESAVEKYSKRRHEETKDLPYEDLVDNLLDFDMTEDEHEEFVYDKQSIQLDDISDSIKKRVIDTIVEEKRISEEEYEREEELKQSGADDDDEYGEDEEKPVLENYRQRNLILHSQPIFMSIVESVVQHTIQSSVTMEGATHAATSGRQFQEQKAKNIDKIKKHQTMDDDAQSALQDEYPSRSDAMVIDRDLVLADSMIHYTLLETFHALKLNVQTPSSVQELCSALRTY